MLENIQLLERDLALALGAEEPPPLPERGRGGSTMAPTWQRQLSTFAGGDGQRMLPAKARSWPGEVFRAAERAQQRGPLWLRDVQPGFQAPLLSRTVPWGRRVRAVGLGWGWTGQL